MDHSRVADRVIRHLGGAENILAAAHCATRLRLILADEKAVDAAALDEDPDLKGTFSTAGQYQIIVGPGDVDTVFARMVDSGQIRAATTEELKEISSARTGNWFTRAVKVLADIFVPLIPILVGGGLLMALHNVLVSEGLFGDLSLIQRFPSIEGLTDLINVLASAPFAFLPVLVGFAATKRFGGNEYLGAGIGMAMVMPQLVNGYEVAATAAADMPTWDIFGLAIAQAGYQGQVLPVLAVAWILATIEKFLHRHLKGTTDFLLTPLITLLITGFLTFAAVGPALRFVGDGVADGLTWAYEAGGPLGGFLFGLIYSPIVITGMHQSFPPFEIALWATAGGSFIFATASMANVAQGAATLAVSLLAREEKLKGLAGASGVSACLGITEPAIFGVNLRLRWPFYIGIGAAAVTSAMIAFFDVKAVALGAAGFLGVVSMRAQDVPMFLVCVATSFVLSFAVAYLYGRYLVGRRGSIDPDSAGTPQEPAPVDEDAPGLPVHSPLPGTVIPLGEVPDPVFAGGTLGPGVAVRPTDGTCVAPVAGDVTVVFPTGHAYGIRTGDGLEVLVHIGLDTVTLKGEGFSPAVAKGDRVEVGQVLCEVDLDVLSARDIDITTPVVVTNSRKFGEVTPVAAGNIAAGDELFRVAEPVPVA